MDEPDPENYSRIVHAFAACVPFIMGVSGAINGN